MAFLWICPMVLSHKANHIGDGTCGYKPADDCDVIFVVNGQTMDATKHGSNHGVYVDLAKVSSGSIAQINVKPKGALVDLYWEVAGQVKIGQPCVVTSNPNAAFCVATLAMDTQTVSVLYVFLSRLQDCTEKVTYLLQTLPTVRPSDIATRANRSPLWQNPLPSRGELHYFKTQRPLQTAWSFEKTDVTPQGENLCFEVCDQGSGAPFVPKMLSVFWPTWVRSNLTNQRATESSWPAAEATPFLIYYPASTGQNRQYGYYLGSYPESFDYLFYLFWCNHNYTVSLNGLKGIPHQMAYARARTVSVIPCLNADQEETGHYNNGDFLVESLEELQATMLRRSGNFFCCPVIGRVALGGFSAGTQLVANTIGKILSHPFTASKLMEVYLFDPHASSLSVLNERLGTLNLFLAHGTTEQKRQKIARYYTQNASSDARIRLSQFLSMAPTTLNGGPSAAIIADSNDGAKTAGIFPASGCPTLDANGDVAYMNQDWTVMHQLIPATMLLDALLRSGFDKEP